MLFTLQPADGHLNPMLGLAAALRDAGHEVVFATSGAYVPRIEARGHRAVAVGMDWLESQGPVTPPPADDPTGHRSIFARLFLRETAREMAADLLDEVGTLRPDLIIGESFEFAGPAVAERADIPFATFDLSFPVDHEVMVKTGDIEDDRDLDALRSHIGLDPATDPDWFRGALQISTFPDRYRETQEDARQAHGLRRSRSPDVVIRPPVLDGVDDADVPGWVEGLEDAVYVSLGTIFTRWFPEVLSTAAAGAATLGRSTVVTYGASADPAMLELPDAPHVHVADYVPQGAVLDRCRAAVTHGGTGTTLGALARGVPVVVIPLGADQFGHARSVRELGAGLVLEHGGLTAEAVATAARSVVEDDSYAAGAAEIAADLAALPPPSHAVPALEDYAGVRR
ncbi:MAG: glycosyltransferase [Nitriliruptorales bacterium]|nr:glycosyltransferase [Nitriliruptorales bacterium]